MPDTLDATEQDGVVFTFGGGRNSRARIEDVDTSEDVGGYNYDLDLGDAALRPRRPFDLVATATNAAQVRGFIQLENVAGTITTLVQAGDTVYQWDGASTFTSVGTVSASARLRGTRESTFTLDDEVIVTDLSKIENVKVWDGLALSDMEHNLGGSLKAAYCFVENERAILGNVKAGAVDTPHVILGSRIGEKGSLSTNDRPNGALGEDAAFFIPVPNLKPINNIVQALGVLGVSTEEHFYQLSGSSAQDFAIRQLYDGSGACGEEAAVNAGNDVIYGRQGVIESLRSTDQAAETEADDLSSWIQPDIEDDCRWTVAYNSRYQQVYFIPDGGNRIWVLHKSKIESGLSPWSLWITDHSNSFQTQALMTLKDPGTGRLTTYMGGDNGEIFRLNGEGAQDGGTTDVVMKRVGGLVYGPFGSLSNLEGYVNYRKKAAVTASLRFLFSGGIEQDTTKTVSLKAAAVGEVYGTGSFYGTTAHYGPARAGVAREEFTIGGAGKQIQPEFSATGDFDISEIGLKVRQA